MAHRLCVSRNVSWGGNGGVEGGGDVWEGRNGVMFYGWVGARQRSPWNGIMSSSCCCCCLQQAAAAAASGSKRQRKRGETDKQFEKIVCGDEQY